MADHSSDADRPGDADDLARLQRPVVVRATVAAVLQALATVLAVAPVVAAVEIARRLLADDRAGLWPVVVAAAVLLAARAVLYVAAAGISHLADADLGAALRHRLADRLDVLPLGWFSAAGASGRIATRVGTDVDLLHHAVAHARGDTASAVAGPLTVVAYLLYVDWRLTLVTLAVLGAAQGIRMRLQARSVDPVRRIAAANAELTAATVEAVQNADVLRAFGGGQEAPARFTAAATAYADADEESQRIVVRQRSLARATVAPATVVLVLGAAATGFAAAGWTDPSAIVAFVLLGIGLFAQLSPLYTARAQRTQARAAAGRIAEVLREPAEPAVPAAFARRPAVPLRVEFDAVRFGYGDGREVLHGVDAVLEPGTVTALVGPSGAGKSTLAALLARFHDVTGGAIRVGGADVREMERDVLYRHVGFLLQDTVLLRRTVRENLTLAVPGADDAVVVAAARAAAIHDRILRLPRGYDSVVGEDARLSGGEAQRVAIARTLLADTPVVVLDEATAHADAESEAAVQDATSRLVAGRTLLVVAHRLHTVTGADQILVLDDGALVERGRHADLLAAGGRYARLWSAQASGVGTGGAG